MSNDQNPTTPAKNIPVSERLIVALDVPTSDKAREIVDTLGETVIFYKLGLELFMAGGYFELIDWLIERNKKVFVDLKFFDVPETVAAAVRQLNNRNISFVTVHGNDNMLKAAVREKKDIKVLAVTVLTSLDRHDLAELGFDCDVQKLVLSRARNAFQIGCDGVISSGLEVSALRSDLGDNFIVVTPGIRPVDNDRVDDQKRTVDVEEAFRNGADYIVMGRPIRNAANPRKTAQEIQKRIAVLFEQ
ncbi:orotidine-5'-phosphate decarboxylase [Nitrosomonas sp. HPC101]|uniref:orotidine-5'-phosphate decarboxylase n=1 Tax=Nitrosomonas sp. HPC101 TaxID=1658667 RepID=UPI00136F6758|nr:orotidine-5'-phosphate decarboxylase [Nitrosomonas sp. HPC101]MXS85037.1 orotidine-5'-phosphate decarboxylase [Nitrosomonas sp. HPC101]